MFGTQHCRILNRIPAWIVIVIIARDFIISGFRLIAAEKGIVIAAGWWGKDQDNGSDDHGRISDS